MSACNWELVTKLPKCDIKDLGSIQKVHAVMPDPTFGVETFAQSETDIHDAANILNSFLRCPMVDCDPDEVRDDEEQEGEVGGVQEDSD